MPSIRQLIIKNFRSINHLEWWPRPGLNCLIGPGDSGKSTVLDAIDLVLCARRSVTFTDGDFYRGDFAQPIEIFATIGDLEAELQNYEFYGNVLRGLETQTNKLFDEPRHGLETVLTIRLRVGSDLEPDWTLFSDRAETMGLECRLKWKHRALVSPNRLGVISYYHLTWGSGSVLPRLSDDGFDANGTLASASRAARAAFPASLAGGVQQVVTKVQAVATSLAVNIQGVKASLDSQSVALSNGAISLHDSYNTPLRQLGTGSTRLLVSGLQKVASASSIFLVDEAEYGLEPFRISKFLHQLGAKEIVPGKQVFLTTHSPYVLRELQALQLHVLRKSTGVPFPPPDSAYSHKVFSLNGREIEQATLRSCAEAFFARKVIVAEGKTEIGIVRGVDLYFEDQGSPTILEKAVYCADGGGDNMFQRASVFQSLLYPTAIFKDSDKSEQHIGFAQQATTRDIEIYEWGNDWATEHALFCTCPSSVIPELLNLACSRKSEDAVNAHILEASNNEYSLEVCRTSFMDSMRIPLAKAAKSKSWFKDIEPAEWIARKIIGPNYQSFSSKLRTVIDGLFKWAGN